MPSQTSQLKKHYTLSAGAGAGKTRHLIEQMLASINQHKKAHHTLPRVIVTTFTKKATGEVKERIMKQGVKNQNWTLLNALCDSSQILISTLHGILYTFLKQASSELAHIEIMNSSQVNALSRSITRNLLLKNTAYLKLFRTYSFLELCEMLIQHDQAIRYQPDLTHLSLKDMDQQHQSIFKEYYQLFRELSGHFQKEWDRKKKQHSLIQIEDLELFTLEKIRNHKSQVALFSKKWDYWFIDEYQDISPIQEQIIQHFTQHAKKVWTVGDAQQSIYLFRSASAEVFQRRKKQTEQQGVFEEKKKNFRSTPDLVYFFNDFFKDHFTPMESSSKEKYNQPVATFLQYEENTTEPEVIATHLNKLLSKGCLEKGICILMKDNKDVRSLAHFLKESKFPVQMHASHTLKREQIDLLLFLRFLMHPFDNKNLIGLLRTPYVHIPNHQIAHLIHQNSEKRLWSLLQDALPEHPVVLSLKTLLQRKNEVGYFETLSFFIENFLMIDLSFYQDPTGEQEHQIWKFLTHLKQKESQCGFQYSQFIEDQLNQEKAYHVEEGGAGAGTIRSHFIQIMTIHQSKGLEFDYVLIPKIDKKLSVPNSQRFSINEKEKKWSFFIKDEKNESLSPDQQKEWKKQQAEKEAEEQKRLLYVAMTRAKKHITFVYSKTAMEKPPASSWLKQFQYFSDIKTYQKKTNDLYSIEVTHGLSCKDENQLRNLSNMTTVNLSSFSKKSPPRKSASIPLNKDILFGSIRGVQIHQLLYSLSMAVDKKLFLNSISHLELKKACEYVMNLKKPPMELLLKQKAEWGYVCKDKSSELEEGRIDLWGEVDRQIWIIDYKSSAEPFKKESWEQLKQYAKVIAIHKPHQKIDLSVIQPFTQQCQTTTFQ